MSKYRKKPVVIDAYRFTGGEDGWNTLMGWLESLGLEGEDADGSSDQGAMWMDGDDLIIPTLEGDHRADPGDWIIRGVKGEFYPCKPDIFEATYEGPFHDPNDRSRPGWWTGSDGL